MAPPEPRANTARAAGALATRGGDRAVREGDVPSGRLLVGSAPTRLRSSEVDAACAECMIEITERKRTKEAQHHARIACTREQA